jgi:CDP-diglyceride synthetase
LYIKINQNIESQNQKKKGRWFLGLAFIFIGIFIIFFIPPDIFFYIALVILIAIIILGLKEIFEAFANRIYRAAKDGFPFEFIIGKPVLTASVFLIYFLISITLIGIQITGSYGQGWALLIFAPPGIYDGVAYLTGRKIGKHKVSALKNVSPNKTWEGTFYGFLASFDLGILILWLKFSYLEFWQIILAALIITTCAVLGDLVVSKFKRIMQIKDSGTILRGHGGILDRLSGQILTIYGIFLLATFWFL